MAEKYPEEKKHNRFVWEDGDVKIFKTKEEFEEYVKNSDKKTFTVDDLNEM